MDVCAYSGGLGVFRLTAVAVRFGGGLTGVREAVKDSSTNVPPSQGVNVRFVLCACKIAS